MARKMLPLAVLAVLFLAHPALAQDKPDVTWDPADSSNYTRISYERPVQYVILHTVEGSALGCRYWFKNPASNVSAHYVIGYGGDIWQMVADRDIAWHAGDWWYNVRSIGIEHEGYAYQNNWTDAQYRASAAITRWACLTYDIPMDRDHIKGHSEIIAKGDPGPYFDWDYYMSLVRTEAPPPPPPPPPPSDVLENVTVNAVDCWAYALTVRSGPSSAYSVIGYARQNQRYVKKGSQNGYDKFDFKGREGWASSYYLNDVTGVAGVKVLADSLDVRTGPGEGYAVAGKVYAGEQYVTAATQGSWVQIYWGGYSYWIDGGEEAEPPPPPPPPPPSGDQAIEVTTSSLNVRSGPSTGYGIVGTISLGQRYVSVETDGSWHKIYFKGRAAWCHGGYVKTVTGVTVVECAVSSLNVRTGPGTGYSIVGQMHAPEKYIQISISGSWFKVWFDGYARWVHGGYTETFGL